MDRKDHPRELLRHQGWYLIQFLIPGVFPFISRLPIRRHREPCCTGTCQADFIPYFSSNPNRPIPMTVFLFTVHVQPHRAEPCVVSVGHQHSPVVRVLTFGHWDDGVGQVKPTEEDQAGNMDMGA